MDVVMTEMELDQLALQHEAAAAKERDTIMREFLTKRRKRGTEGPTVLAYHFRRADPSRVRVNVSARPRNLDQGTGPLRPGVCESPTGEAGWTDPKSQPAVEPAAGSCSQRASERPHSCRKRGQPQEAMTHRCSRITRLGGKQEPRPTRRGTPKRTQQPRRTPQLPLGARAHSADTEERGWEKRGSLAQRPYYAAESQFERFREEGGGFGIY